MGGNIYKAYNPTRDWYPRYIKNFYNSVLNRQPNFFKRLNICTGTSQIKIHEWLPVDT